MIKNQSAIQEKRVPSLGWEDLLKEEMATHSSILACRILRTEEPGLQNPMDRGAWPAESYGQRSLAGYCLHGRTESDTTDAI